MNIRKDFNNMTTDELLPIVSMRPGGKYTKEELKEAREAFMRSLQPETVNVPDFIQEINESDLPEDESEVSEEITFASSPSELSDTAADEVPLPAKPSDEVFDTKEIVIPVPKPAFKDVETKKRNPVSGFLYTLYTSFLLPLLAIEALFITALSAAVVVFCNSEKNVLLCFVAAMLYAVTIALLYHQFMNGTRLGTILNRALLIGAAIYGFLRINHGSLYSGIALIAVSALYLIFFTVYDSVNRTY